jgi:hypothetical protein
MSLYIEIILAYEMTSLSKVRHCIKAHVYLHAHVYYYTWIVQCEYIYRYAYINICNSITFPEVMLADAMTS